MRELEFLYLNGLKVGLKKVDKIPINDQVLTECYGVRVGEFGLETYEPLDNSITNMPTTSWPFPQIFKGARANYCITRDEDGDKVWKLTDNVLTLIKELDVETYGVGEMFEFVDYGSFIILSNGVVFIYGNVDAGAYFTSGALEISPTVKTICNFRGQLIGGNVTSDWYDCGSNSIIWGKIGSSDFSVGNDNVAGYMNMLSPGEVVKVKSLNDSIIVYTTTSVYRLTPYENTFGIKQMLDIGIPCITAVNGNLQNHLFVDTIGRLWSVNDEGVKKLDYSPYISNISDPLVIYDHIKGDYYISDLFNSFLLTRNGLSEIFQFVTAVWNDSGINGYTYDSIDQEFRLTTNFFDFGYSAMKTIFSIEVGGQYSNPLYYSISWRKDRSVDMETTEWTQLNDVGFGVRPISGTEFQVNLKSISYEHVNIDYLKVRWKMTDIRNIRGIYAAPPRGQSYDS